MYLDKSLLPSRPAFNYITGKRKMGIDGRVYIVAERPSGEKYWQQCGQKIDGSSYCSITKRSQNKLKDSIINVIASYRGNPIEDEPEMTPEQALEKTKAIFNDRARINEIISLVLDVSPVKNEITKLLNSAPLNKFSTTKIKKAIYKILEDPDISEVLKEQEKLLITAIALGKNSSNKYISIVLTNMLNNLATEPELTKFLDDVKLRLLEQLNQQKSNILSLGPNSLESALTNIMYE